MEYIIFLFFGIYNISDKCMCLSALCTWNNPCNKSIAIKVAKKVYMKILCEEMKFILSK